MQKKQISQSQPSLIREFGKDLTNLPQFHQQAMMGPFFHNSQESDGNLKAAVANKQLYKMIESRSNNFDTISSYNQQHANHEQQQKSEIFNATELNLKKQKSPQENTIQLGVSSQSNSQYQNINNQFFNQGCSNNNLCPVDDSTLTSQQQLQHFNNSSLEASMSSFNSQQSSVYSHRIQSSVSSSQVLGNEFSSDQQLYHNNSSSYGASNCSSSNNSNSSHGVQDSEYYSTGYNSNNTSNNISTNSSVINSNNHNNGKMEMMMPSNSSGTFGGAMMDISRSEENTMSFADIQSNEIISKSLSEQNFINQNSFNNITAIGTNNLHNQIIYDKQMLQLKEVVACDYDEYKNKWNQEEQLVEEKQMHEVKSSIPNPNSMEITHMITEVKRKFPQIVEDYLDDIIIYLRKIEEKFDFPISFLESIDQSGAVLRANIVDWLITIQLKLKLKRETLFLCVNIFDRFMMQDRLRFECELMKITAISSLFIAAQIEEIYPPGLSDFAYFLTTANYPSKRAQHDIITREGDIVNCLGFSLSPPTHLNFMDPFMLIAQIDAKQQQLCNYLVEISLLDSRMLMYRPSKLACAAILISIQLYNMKSGDALWSQELENSTGYTQQQLEECANNLYFMMHQIPNSPYKSAFNQYKQPDSGQYINPAARKNNHD